MKIGLDNDEFTINEIADKLFTQVVFLDDVEFDTETLAVDGEVKLKYFTNISYKDVIFCIQPSGGVNA